MLRVTSIISGLFLLALGVLLTVPAAEAQQPPPPTTRTLVNQRVDELPQGALCWTVNVNASPPGSRNPVVDYHQHGLNLVYHVEGSPTRLEYAGGPALTFGPGEGWFIGQHNWHAHLNTGSTPGKFIIFALTCGAPIPQPPGTRLERTEPAPLPGIRSGPVPYQVQLLEVIGRPGSQTSPQSTTGPLTTYVLEGTVAVTTPTGVTQYKAGDLLVIPPGTPFTTATVGDTTARALVTLLTPAGEPPSRTVPPGVDSRVLVNQRVDELPQGALCWKVIRPTLAPGARMPADGYQGNPLTLSYVLEGDQQRIEYAGGPTVTHKRGEGVFIGTENWFARTNTGTTPLLTIVFQLTCEAGRGTSVGITPSLPGIRPGPVPYQVVFQEVRGTLGSQGPVRVNPFPTTFYLVDGEVAVASPGGITRYRSGDLWVVPPNTPHQFNTTSNSSRYLVPALFPVGQVGLVNPPGVSVPSLGPAALPRTGGGLPWTGPIAVLTGLVLLAAGFGLRRAKA